MHPNTSHPAPHLSPALLHPLLLSQHSCEIGLGDIQSEEERDIVLQLLLPGLEAPVEEPVVKVTLSYFNVVTSTLDTVECEIVASRTGEYVDIYICVCIYDLQVSTSILILMLQDC